MFDRAYLLDLLCGMIRDGPFTWPASVDDDAERLYETARDEGVHLLIAQRLWERGCLADCPTTLRERLTGALRQQVAAEEITRPELLRVLAALATAGVPPVMMKGGALAYTHYSSPALRPRVDTDLLIAAPSRPSAAITLESLGYQRVPVTSGDLVMRQESYARTDPGGARHVIDVHWEVSNPQVFTRALPTGELLAGSVPIPQLGDAARAPAPVHGLAIACVHRLAHHPHRDRLIWNFDIHLVAERLSDAERDAFVAFAGRRQLHAVCIQGLTAAARCFRGEGLARLTALLEREHPAAREPSAVFAARPMRRLDVLRSDLAALQGWRAKLQLAREHLFPPPAYMRQRYGIRSRALLPLSYGWRILRGGAGWLWPAAAAPDDEE